MPTTVVVQATRRDEFGKNSNRRLRITGRIPAVIYGRGLDPVPVTVDPRDVSRILHSDTGRNTIFKLNIEGTARDVLIRDFQLDPVRDSLVHADFQAIAMDQTMAFQVPVEMVGEAKGVKAAGGTLDLVMRTIEVECLPGDVPQSITVQVDELQIGDAVRVRQLTVDETKIKILSEPDLVVLTVSAPVIEEAPPVPVAEGEAVEPEVIKKGKGEEEEAEKE
jgi:large subunit ribosomal protein L25